MILYLCFFALCAVVSASITGLYCQDPDTGKLHAVNTTWPSQTFCGNYTCKLRKKNTTETEYKPLIKINITDKHIKSLNDMTSSTSSLSNVEVRLNNTEVHPVFNKDSFKKLNKVKNTTKDNDRYLTESEINAITDILHTVKKSDLDAIIEIYNIAQDILNEESIYNNTDMQNAIIDKLSFLKKATNAVKKKNSNDDKSMSYFYEPLHKGNINENLKDMKNTDTNPTTTYKDYPYPYPLSYYQGGRQDYGKMPYYYPVSNFQRLSSYIYNRPYASTSFTPYQKPFMAPTVRPCNTPLPTFFPSPWHDRSLIKPYIRPQHHVPMQAMLLPYPFSYVRPYNYSNTAPHSHNNYPWSPMDTYKRYYLPYYGNSNPPISQYPSPPIAEEVKEVEMVNSVEVDIKHDSKSNEDTELPEWESKPLLSQILDEVRANIKNKTKLVNPTRKNVKLERVLKQPLIDESNRKKRSILKESKAETKEENIFETYIEKIITEPGFFRVGNLSAPYPNCCPQKIP
ncbi:unnamed protein product [Leptidea sinapis]|uniref:Uncharacterized protein n=1 Tax=Leptidea sinapis TaxID=189913 RepID=A0A5E4QE16_9NEOP|nr:unnamed protein product [Leptidea sinapis]